MSASRTAAHGPSSLTVASVPAGHLYVRHLAPVEPLPGTPTIVRLADPDPDDPSRVAGPRWWPPVMLDPDWIDANASTFDVLHLHFGFDAFEPADLEATVAALRRGGIPLVYTVHDLRNPHHVTPEAHEAHLDVLLRHADALITLTEGAATEIEQRWGRRPEVIPHPHIVELDDLGALQRRASERASRRAPGEPFRVGVHLKSLRANLDPLPVIAALLQIAEQDGDMVVQVNGHEAALANATGGAAVELRAFLAAHRGSPALDVRLHDYLADSELWEYLSSLDASVLPYRFGTHSGWLEACLDLGTAVLAPDIGYFADQGPVRTYELTADGPDLASLRSVVQGARRLPAPQQSVEFRTSQRQDIAAGHARVYARAVEAVEAHA